MVSFHIHTQLCMNILVYSQKHKKSQNEFQWTTKHVFWQDYFVHMWLDPKLNFLNPLNIIFGQMV
jgi:hypothetical protein